MRRLSLTTASPLPIPFSSAALICSLSDRRVDPMFRFLNLIHGTAMPHTNAHAIFPPPPTPQPRHTHTHTPPSSSAYPYACPFGRLQSQPSLAVVVFFGRCASIAAANSTSMFSKAGTVMERMAMVIPIKAMAMAIAIVMMITLVTAEVWHLSLRFTLRIAISKLNCTRKASCGRTSTSFQLADFRTPTGSNRSGLRPAP